jgi:hypothetical protein
MTAKHITPKVTPAITPSRPRRAPMMMDVNGVKVMVGSTASDVAFGATVNEVVVGSIALILVVLILVEVDGDISTVVLVLESVLVAVVVVVVV